MTTIRNQVLEIAERCFHKFTEDMETGEVSREEEKAPKRARTVAAPSIKEACLKAVSKFYIYICLKKGISPYNIVLATSIGGALKTVFQISRQSINRDKGSTATKANEQDFMIGTEKLTYKEAMEYFKTACELHGLYLTQNRAQICLASEWISVMSPLIAFIHGFRLRMKEVRLGHHQIKKQVITKDGMKLIDMKVSEMGLEPRHHVLLEGCTYPPDVQSSMAQSLGPLTVALKLAMTNRDKYTAKYETAMERFYKHMDFGSQIGPVLTDASENQAPTLLGKLGDLSLLVPPRWQRRAFMPLNAIAFFMLTKKEIEGFAPIKSGGRLADMAIVEDSKIVSRNAELLDYSGKGAVRVWENFVRNVKPAMFMLPNESYMASEWVFHAYWGTFNEDFGILASVTNYQNWRTRNEISPIFQSGRQGLQYLHIGTISFTHYSKLTSGNISNTSGAQQGQVTSIPIFSGNRKHKYSEELVESVQTARTGVGAAYKKDFNGIVDKVLNETTRILEANKEKDLSWGNTKWFRVNAVDGATEITFTEDADKVVESSGKLFMSG